MKKQFSSTLVLTLVFVLLLGWYLLWEKKFRPEREKGKEAAKELIQLDSKELQEILIERAKLPAPGSKEAKGLAVSYETIRVKRVNGHWTLQEPINDPGDEAGINNLASTLTSTKYDDIVQENVQDWKPYGLAEPQIKITAIKDGTKTSLWVGADTPVGYGNYVRKPDSNTLYQTGRALRTAFERKIEDLRDKKLMNWTRTEVGEVEIHSPAGEVIVKHLLPDDKWLLARQDLPADENEWNKSLNAILEMRATGFASEKATDLSKFGLSKPTITAQFTKAGTGERLTFSIGRVKEKNYVKRSDRDTIYEVAKEGLDLLARSALVLADLNVARFNRFQAKRIRIEHPGSIGSGAKRESVELVKAGPDWRIESDPVFRVSPEKVDAFLTSLQDLKLTDFVPASKAPAAMKLVVIEEKTKDGKPFEFESVGLNIANLDGSFVLGSRSGLNKSFKIKLTDFRTINLGKGDFAEVQKEAKAPDKGPEAKPKTKS
jgi:hypothetical protein